MAAIADIFAAVRLQLDSKGFEAQASAVGTKAGQTAGAKMSSQLNNKLKSALGGAVIGAAVAGGLQSATLAFGAFEQRMNEVFTLLPGITRKAMGKMQDDVKAFARETGKTTDEVIPALYQAISAGVPPDNVFDFLRTANKGAVAGVASVEDEVALLSAVTKGFGDASLEATTKAADLAQLQVKLGQTTLPELAASYGKAVPLAAALGVSQEELAASSASLFGVTGNTAEVMTQLKAVFTALIAQNPNLTKGLKSMGFETSGAAIEALGLQGTLDGLVKSTGGSTQALQKMLGSSEAVTAGLALSGAQAETFTSNLAAMKDGVGTVDKAFEQMAQGGAFEASKFAAKLETLAIDVGQVVSKFGPLPQIIASTFGPSMARAIGAGIGGLAGLIIPRIAAQLGLTLPAFLAGGTAQGVAMGGAAATSAIATETAGVVAGQAAVGAAAAPAAAAAGTTIGGAFGAAFSAALALAIPLAVAAAIVAASVPVGEWFRDMLPDEFKGPGGRGESEAQRRINEARAKMGLPPLGPGGRPLANATGELFGPPRPPQMGGRSPDERQAKGDVAPVFEDDPRLAAIIKRAQEAGRTPKDVFAAAMATLQRNIARDAKSKDWEGGFVRGFHDPLTKMQQQLHDDLLKAIDTIKTTNDPKALSAAVAGAIKAILGGSGSAATTKALIADLETQRTAALARGDTATVAMLTAAIKQIEPFAKGRQWQQEQIAEAKKIVASNKTTADKVAALKKIQDDLLSHQRTMAADIVAQQIATITAIDKLPVRLKNALGGLLNTGFHPGKDEPGPTPPKPKKSPQFGGKSPDDRDSHAAGLLGLTQGATSLGVAGEAGREAVAIVRNPKPITAGAMMAATLQRVFVTNWPPELKGTATATQQTATNTAAHVKVAIKQTQKQTLLEAALDAIKKRAIAAGHLGLPGPVHDTLRDDLERGLTLRQIANAVPHATGGFFRPRQPMIVGELRPELLIPDVGGRIEPRVPEGPGAGGNTYNVAVQGLLRARDPFEVATQLRRLGSFGVLTPRREPA